MPVENVEKKRVRLTTEQLTEAERMIRQDGNELESVAIFFGTNPPYLKRKLGMVKTRVAKPESNGNGKHTAPVDLKETSNAFILELEKQAKFYEEKALALRVQSDKLQEFVEKLN